MRQAEDDIATDTALDDQKSVREEHSTRTVQSVCAAVFTDTR